MAAASRPVLEPLQQRRTGCNFHFLVNITVTLVFISYFKTKIINQNTQ
jgi:hypothetical protein